ncbi:neurogenic locus notch homolog protein 3-like [Venturia canescens]|uniref:neurogenic locus notch homolog protein 3-like n=1 Tax=Venturia canescens TaxID=32260 RepID=UPI001C9CFBD6|nr:neurogenic locus notch homolog protein 3-like [Venturia canescens]
MLGKSTIFIVTVLLTFGVFVRTCDNDQMRSGCRIVERQCGCGFGCKAEFRYDSMEACRMALKGGKHDICSHQRPCLHEGSCLQISQEPGFKCRCEGTGYHGPQCDKPCPRPNNPHFRGPFPYECVVI